MNESFKLCYVEGGFAWFTTAPLEVQTGDDWDDRPYEHNAERPYEWRPYMAEGGVAPYRLMWGCFSGPLETPADYGGSLNSWWSVDEINAGHVPWLKSLAYLGDDPGIKIYAGTNPWEFACAVCAAGGKLWVPRDVTVPLSEWLQGVDS